MLFKFLFVSCLRAGDGISLHQFLFSKHGSSPVNVECKYLSLHDFCYLGKKTKQRLWCLVRFHNIAWHFTSSTLFRFLRPCEKRSIHQDTWKLSIEITGSLFVGLGGMVARRLWFCMWCSFSVKHHRLSSYQKDSKVFRSNQQVNKQLSDLADLWVAQCPWEALANSFVSVLWCVTRQEEAQDGCTPDTLQSVGRWRSSCFPKCREEHTEPYSYLQLSLMLLKRDWKLPSLGFTSNNH